MRVLKFRFWKNKQLMGFRELNTGGIIDIPWDWDSVDQFTGLLDKTGVEIYEGDVLRESGEYPDGSYDERVFNVEWIVDDIHSGWNIAPCDTWYSCVIGNIYEHPDLLK